MPCHAKLLTDFISQHHDNLILDCVSQCHAMTSCWLTLFTNIMTSQHHTMTICNCLYIQTPCHDDVTTESVSMAIFLLQVWHYIKRLDRKSNFILLFTTLMILFQTNIHKGNLFNPRKGQIMFPGWFCQSRAAAWDDFLEKTIWTNAKLIGPSRVCALPLAVVRNEDGHYFR